MVKKSEARRIIKHAGNTRIPCICQVIGGKGTSFLLIPFLSLVHFQNVIPTTAFADV